MSEISTALKESVESLFGVSYGSFSVENFYQPKDPYGFGARYFPPQVPHLGIGPRPSGEGSWVYLQVQFDSQAEPNRLHPEQINALLSQRPLEELYFFLDGNFPPGGNQGLSIEEVAHDGNFLRNMENSYRLKKDKRGQLTLISRYPYKTSEQRAAEKGAVGPNFGRFFMEIDPDHKKQPQLTVRFGEESPISLDKSQIQDLLFQRPDDELQALFELAPNLVSWQGVKRPILENDRHLGRIEFAYRLKRTGKNLKLVPLWDYQAYPATSLSLPTSFRKTR